MHNIIKCLVPAAVLTLGMPVMAFAQCPAAGGTPPVGTVTNDERNEVMDLMARYAWAMDNRNTAVLLGLFSAGGSYEVCRMGATLPDISVKNPEMESHFNNVFRQLTEEGATASRLLGNYLIGKTGNTINLNVTSTVFMQYAGKMSPELDYVARIYITLVRNNTLFIQKMIIVTTDGRISIRAR